MATTLASQSGTFKFGGDLVIARLGFGAMRIVGDKIWGPPRDRDEVLRVLRRLPELGIDFIDTADSYGPFISEELIREALHPYDGIVVATKAGLVREGPDGPSPWAAVGRREYLRQAVLLSLVRLDVETIDLLQLHRVDVKVPLEESLNELKALQDEGKIRHLGLSNVSIEQIEAAREVFEVTTVQNLYNLADRSAEDVLDYCEREGIGFIPWFPLAAGDLAAPGGPLAEVAAAHDATPGQVALAWLLQRSPVMLPIPGTSTVAHLEENVAAAKLKLTDDEFARLDAAAK
jgi:aryl-alcohol dehydrogenase-like predicted oxidoreductase